jgi:hypothetical protein
LLNVFDRLAEEYRMRVIDANESGIGVFRALKEGVIEVISTMKGARL